jgi:hypothetical protein
MYVEHLDSGEIQALTADPPPAANAFLIDDQLGESGWEVELPDASTAKYYVQLPESMRVRISLHLPDPPAEDAGRPPTDTSNTTLCRRYARSCQGSLEFPRCDHENSPPCDRLARA